MNFAMGQEAAGSSLRGTARSASGPSPYWTHRESSRVDLPTSSSLSARWEWQ